MLFGASLQECVGGSTPVAAELYNPIYDMQFGQSIGGMIWPRGYIGAAAFWNYQPHVDPNDITFLERWNAFNDVLIARGSLSCPTGSFTQTRFALAFLLLCLSCFPQNPSLFVRSLE